MRKIPYNILFTKGHTFLEKDMKENVEVLVKKLKGNELKLIPILMFIFSIGGTTYGMLEETVFPYSLTSFQ